MIVCCDSVVLLSDGLELFMFSDVTVLSIWVENVMV